MNAAEITALCTGIPTVLAAIGALIASIKAKSSADTAASHAVVTRQAVEAHLYNTAGMAGDQENQLS